LFSTKERGSEQSFANLRFALELLDPLQYLRFGQHSLFGKQLDQSVERQHVGVAELREQWRFAFWPAYPQSSSLPHSSADDPALGQGTVAVEHPNFSSRAAHAA